MESSNLRNLRSRTIGSPNLPKTPIKAPPDKKNKNINLSSIVYKIKFSSINISQGRRNVFEHTVDKPSLS